MKIFIDSTFFSIYEWDDGRLGKAIFRHRGRDNALSFQGLVDKILTRSQLEKYIGGDQDYVFKISKKRALLLTQEIEKLRLKENKNHA